MSITTQDLIPPVSLVAGKSLAGGKASAPPSAVQVAVRAAQAAVTEADTRRSPAPKAADGSAPPPARAAPRNGGTAGAVDITV